jgi:hypothetical protein
MHSVYDCYKLWATEFDRNCKKKRLLTLEKEEKDENLLKVNRSQGGFTSKLYTHPNQAIASS